MRKKEEKTDADEEEETVDDKVSEGSEVREMRRDFRHLCPESCARCQQNPFECGCLDVNFESRRARDRREKGERERASWNLKGQMGLPGLEERREELDGEGNWRCETGSWYQDQWRDSGVWRAESEGKKTGGTEKTLERTGETTQGGGRSSGGSSKGERGHGDSENESGGRNLEGKKEEDRKRK